MIQRMLASALFAGFAAGLFAAVLHFAFVQKLILLGEQYESGALVHFQGADGTAPAHAPGEPADHAHAAPAEAEGGAFPRDALTVLFTAFTYVAYALILVAGFAVAERFGYAIDRRTGLLWGIAGFAAFQLAPAMGLAPELPGTIAADLTARQYWWLGTVLATGAGLAVLAYGRGLAAILLAAALLAAPHLIGAPELVEYWGVAPPEVGAAFAARVLGVGLAVWALMGWLAGRFWSQPA
jgi:cobalt transporter subunit CbtA